MTVLTGRRTGRRLMRGARGDYIQILYDEFGTARDFTVYDADSVIYQMIKEHISPQTLRGMSGDQWITAIGKSDDPSTSAYKYRVTSYGEMRVLEYRKSLDKHQRRG